MHKISSSIFAVALSFLAGTSSVSANFDLTLALHPQVEKPLETAFAPGDLTELLGLLFYGSAGTSEAAFQSQLFRGVSREDMVTMVAERRRDFAGFRQINSLWLREGMMPKEDFVSAARGSWGMQLGQIPANSNAAEISGQINRYYARQTNGHLGEVVVAEDFADDSALACVLVSAFVSAWSENYFTRVRPELFFASPEVRFRVQMMAGEGELRYFENADWQAAIWGYQSEAFELLVLLPKEPALFEQLRSNLGAAVFDQVLADAAPREVQYSLPKVNFQSSIDWTPILARTALKPIFTRGEADFSNLHTPATDEDQLFIAKIKQRVVVRWDDLGTVAEATTSASGEPFGSSDADNSDPVAFVANHPFIFAIINREFGQIAFYGVVSAENQLVQ